MPNTSVHFPEDILRELDRTAEARRVSRNRLIVDACRLALRAGREWPEGFFSDEHLSAPDRRELRRGAADFARVVARSRRNRKGTPW